MTPSQLSFYLQPHVLDLSDTPHEQRVKALENELGSIELDFGSHIAWSEYPDVRARVARLLAPATSTRTDIIKWDPTRQFESYGEFEQSFDKTLGADAGEEWAAAKKASKRAEKAAPGFLDYLAQLIPRKIVESGSKVLRAFAEALRKVFDWFVDGAKAVNRKFKEVLLDPDAYYLRLRGEVTEFARGRTAVEPLVEALVLLPDLARLYLRLLFDERVSFIAKKNLAKAVLYLVSPIDLLPEVFLGPIGYVDDVLILADCLLDLLRDKYVSPELLNEHWAGSVERLEQIRKFAEEVDAAWIVALFRQIAGKKARA